VTFRSVLHPAPAWTAEEVKQFLRQAHPDDYTLLDVGHPREYAAGHLPGSRLIPLEELAGRLHEIDPAKTVLVYGGSGLRSRAASHVLVNAGFRQVRSMKGGIHAWRGQKAQGLPQEDFAFFAQAESPLEQIVLAWRLENGAHRFYLEMTAIVRDHEAASLFRELAEAEAHHKRTLQALYEGISGQPAGTAFPAGLLPASDAEWMEGGMRVEEAIAWTRGRQICDILELSVALETNAYDRYLLLRRDLTDENSQRVFEILSDEERRHLQKLEHLLEHFI
jgi:rubrerythrin/rhodanese-related sulfurtransferase